MSTSTSSRSAGSAAAELFSQPSAQTEGHASSRVGKGRTSGKGGEGFHAALGSALLGSGSGAGCRRRRGERLGYGVGQRFEWR